MPAHSGKGGMVAVSVGLLIVGLAVGYLVGKGMGTSSVAEKGNDATLEVAQTVTFSNLQLTLPLGWSLANPDPNSAEEQGATSAAGSEHITLKTSPQLNSMIVHIFYAKADQKVVQSRLADYRKWGNAYTTTHGGEVFFDGCSGPTPCVEFYLAPNLYSMAFGTPLNDPTSEVGSEGGIDPEIAKDLLDRITSIAK